MVTVREAVLATEPRREYTTYLFRRPKLHPSDRLFWICLSRLWAEWRQALIIVTPDTVLRWHRGRFRDYRTMLSRSPKVGRPSINAEIVALVRKMVAANPRWGAPRIHGRVEGWRGTSSGPSPAPATSNGANGFPVRRFPATPARMRSPGGPYSFSPESAIPRTKARWKNRKMIAVGIMPMTAMAMISW
jgi:hypothetical protein